jgi:hypothetical protein
MSEKNDGREKSNSDTNAGKPADTNAGKPADTYADDSKTQVINVNYVLATLYIVYSVVLIIIPWALPGLFTLSSAFVADVLGVLILITAIAHISYINTSAKLKQVND